MRGCCLCKVGLIGMCVYVLKAIFTFEFMALFDVGAGIR